MAGSSLRLARSPVPPKMTSVVGWTGSRSRPSTSGFSCCSTTATALLRVRLALRGRVGGGLHHPVLHAVVDHLHVVAGAGRAEVSPPRPVLLGGGRREHVEDRAEPLHGLVGPADHH